MCRLFGRAAEVVGRHSYARAGAVRAGQGPA